MDRENPDEPGLALLGKKPLIGTLRRSLGIPVLRDQLLGPNSPVGQQDTERSSDDEDSDDSETDTVGRRVPTIDF
jgi:hypothetical protein